MKRKMTLEEFLQKIEEEETIDTTVLRTLALIPEREYYSMFLSSSPYENKRREINMLIQKKKSFAYARDREVAVSCKRAVREYDAMIKEEVERIKADFGSYLLKLDIDTKLDWLWETISRYRLLPYLVSKEWS